MVKIKYNSEFKGSIINDLNNCIDYLNNINNSFYNTDVPNDFYYRNTFVSIKENVILVKENLFKYKESIINFMNDVEKDELDMLALLNNIDYIEIEKF